MLYEVGMPAGRARNPSNRHKFDHVGTFETKDIDQDGVTDVVVDKAGVIRGARAQSEWMEQVVPKEPPGLPLPVVLGGLGLAGLLAGLIGRKIKRRRASR